MVLFWFRNDLRIVHHEGFEAAQVKAGELNCSLKAIYVYDVSSEGSDAAGFVRLGSASRWWLHCSLTKLKSSLQNSGLDLDVVQGRVQEEIVRYVAEHDVSAVYMSRRFRVEEIAEDKNLIAALQKSKVEVHTFNTTLLSEPWEILNGEKKPYRVYTPYFKNLFEKYRSKAFEPVSFAEDADAGKSFTDINKLKLLPKIPWDKTFYDVWNPGEKGAHENFEIFLKQAIFKYKVGRDFPSESYVSMLSPHLHFGEISPKFLWSKAMSLKCATKEDEANRHHFLRELVWREFAYYLLYYFPFTVDKPLRPEFEEFPWLEEKAEFKKRLKAWQRGMTGYPIVDAGMRQLWQTGWMHNRVRMIVASFLIKDLLIPWQEGAKWFWETLVDADLASNTLGWQWTAGCGADAAPFFRVFNPTLQGDKFDPDGTYIRQWVPELKNLSAEDIHKPFDADAAELKRCGIEVGKTYPKPIVNHGEARLRALQAFERIKRETLQK